MKLEKSLFGKNFKYVLVLTALAWMVYTLPAIKLAIKMTSAYDDQFVTAAAAQSTMAVVTAVPVESTEAACPVGYICTPNPKLTISSVVVSGPNPEVVSYRFNLSGVQKIELNMYANGSTESIKGFTATVVGTKNSALGKTTINTNKQTIAEWQVAFTNKTGKDITVGVKAIGYNGRKQVGADADAIVIPGNPVPVCPAGYMCTPVGGGDLSLSLDPSSPATTVVQIPDPARNEYLQLPVLVFDLKAPSNSPIIVKSLNAQFFAKGSGQMQKASLYSGKTLVASTIVENNVAVFKDLTEIIPAGVKKAYTATLDIVNIAPEGFAVSSNIGAISAYVYGNESQNLGVAGAAEGNQITVMPSGNIAVGSMATTYGPVHVNPATGQSTQAFTFEFIITGGNFPMYISRNADVAVSVTKTMSTTTNITTYGLSAPASASDGPDYYYIAPGQSTHFTAQYLAQGPSIANVTVTATSINVGSSTSNIAAIKASSPTISGFLRANIFH